MARSYAEIQNVIEQILQDTTPTYYDTTETGFWIEEELKEVARYSPHMVDVTFKIESRTGTATSTSSNNLVDATKDQFLFTDDDDEKVIHNTTDNTWAVVKTYTDAENLVLSADIMASSENYEIYNKRCTNKKQIYIGDVTDYLWIDSVEYPIGTKRNWRVDGEILEIDVDSVADSDTTQTNLPNVDVIVRFAKPHRLCQLTDLAGACTAIEPAGEITLAVKGLATTEVIEIGDELHIAGHRNLYTVTTGVTLNSGAGTGDIVVYPGMEAATAVDDVITFTKSTLLPQHEEVFCQLVAAKAAISKGAKSIQQIETAITTLANVNSAVDNMTGRVTQAIADIASGRTELAKTPAIVTSAATAIGKVDAEVTQAVADLDAGRIEVEKVVAIIGVAIGALSKVDAEVSQAITDLDAGRTEAAKTPALITKAEADIALVQGQITQARADILTGRPLINEINKGGADVSTKYTNSATAELNNANAYIGEAQAHFNQATKDESIATTYAQLANTGLANAAGYIREAYAYFQQAAADESLMRSYVTQAQGVLVSARGYLTEAEGYFAQATKDESIARTYASTGSAELNSAVAYLNQAGGYIREITSRLNVASSFRLYQEWGERKLVLVLADLKTLSPPRTKRRYSTA